LKILLIHPFNTEIAAKLDFRHCAQMFEKSTNDLSSSILKQLEAQIDTVDENAITSLQKIKRSNSFAVSSISFPTLLRFPFNYISRVWHNYLDKDFRKTAREGQRMLKRSTQHIEKQ